MSAWDDDKTQIIEFLEDLTFALPFIRGVVETIGQNEPILAKCAGILETLSDKHKVIRSTYFEQGILFEENKAKKKGKHVKGED